MPQKFTKAEVVEAVAALDAVGAALLAACRDTGAAGADLRFAVSTLQAQAESRIRAADVAAPTASCFDLARRAGAGYAGLAAVVAAAEGFAPSGLPARVVTTMAVRYGLGQIARVLSRTSFASRNEVDAAMAAVGALFDRAEGFAAGNGEVAAYTALVGLHAALVGDLSARSRPLPRLVAYAFPRTFSALSLAHRLYGDASRAAELAAENGAFNPAFMPASGIALSA